MAVIDPTVHTPTRAYAEDVDLCEMQIEMLANPMRFQSSLPLQTSISRLEIAMMLEKVGKYATNGQTWPNSTVAPNDDEAVWWSSSTKERFQLTVGQEEALRKLSTLSGLNFEELMDGMIGDTAKLEEKLFSLLFCGPTSCSSMSRVDLSKLLLVAFWWMRSAQLVRRLPCAE
mmetsp:Transcript_34990/g.90475  ORF Transcript_34990/g.90475 Transcript_34990/m.90475 type:complete len:173 (-) Transcript_34990:330-848(-)